MSFNGGHHHRSAVSHRGNTPKTETKEELLHRVLNNRQDRQREQQKRNAALIIQSHYRGYRSRKSSYEYLSSKYEILFSNLDDTNINTLHAVIKHLIVMYKIKREPTKLLSVYQKWKQMKCMIQNSDNEGTCLVHLRVVRSLVMLHYRVPQNHQSLDASFPSEVASWLYDVIQQRIDNMNTEEILSLLDIITIFLEMCDFCHMTNTNSPLLKRNCDGILSSEKLANAMIKIINHGDGIKIICKFCYWLILQPDNDFILKLLLPDHTILKHLWTSEFSARVQQLANGTEISCKSSHDLIPQLMTFCVLFQFNLCENFDAELHQEIDMAVFHPFPLNETSNLSAILRDVMVTIALETNMHKTTPWTCLLKQLRQLLKLLYKQNSQHPFCKPEHWESCVLCDRLTEIPSNAFQINRENLSESVQKMMKFLECTPFVFSFKERVMLFRRLVNEEKKYIPSESITLNIRRNQLYSDAFDQLRYEDIRKRLHVRMIDALGHIEEGFGEGVFREFFSELIKEAFSPNQELFDQTVQQELYPNRQAHTITDYQQHFYFTGQLLGKALYENLLVELPLAGFFLHKISHAEDVSIHYLSSVDSNMYCCLMRILLNKDESIHDLDLCNDTDEDSDNESSITVTDDNKAEFIYSYADRYLNKQIHQQCTSFREGLFSVIPCEWLHFFNHGELQVLISGGNIKINIADLREHTNYSGGYSDNHPCIHLFWHVVDMFTEEEKQLLLAFVTSCQRPPLFGFKHLNPQFRIQYATGADKGMLPTASTCAHLLKLPDYRELRQMKEKVLCAINSKAGFRFS